ncbi:hypothetical protein AQ490_10450 [Wenjunlia vitaminophila]|uniref:Uncharacterized protein n=1 Tax=Wenjunlia vitaminophila TaxID=76728 RepID=A0A0T6LM20_WENVI|nr:hypothetical protein AQ490_10450 [Wenjunlia vitaminophila]
MATLDPASAAGVKSRRFPRTLRQQWLRGRRWLSPRHPVGAAVLLAGLLHIMWALFLASGGGDLAAQDAWAGFVAKHPGSAYNLAWYGGMHTVNYSVISPYLMAVLGVRTVAVIAGTVSAGLVAMLLLRAKVARPMPAALWAACALAGNAASGRVTFALGVMWALAAVAAVFAVRWSRRARAVGTVAFGALATMSSPVAGMFLMVVAAALFLTRRRPPAYALAVGPVAVVGVTMLLFPFRGMQPISVLSVFLPAGTAIAVAVLAPKSWKTIRVGAAVYAVGVILAWVIPSPVGTNVDRLSLLFAGVVLLAMAATRPKVVAIYAVFAVAAVWAVAKPGYDLARTRPAASWNAQTAPLIEELKRVGADRGRVEVVPERSHREASGLSPYVILARGWNRQLDLARHPLFYDGSLTAEKYRQWLRRWAVHYVVLPEAPPDDWAAKEADLVRGGLPFLEPVWSDENWRLYRFTEPVPLAEAPADVERAGPDEVVVEIPAAGSVLVRIPWSPWLSLDDDNSDGSCLAPEGEWTRLHASGPGEYRIGARYQLPRGTPCDD